MKILLISCHCPTPATEGVKFDGNRPLDEKADRVIAAGMSAA